MMRRSTPLWLVLFPVCLVAFSRDNAMAQVAGAPEQAATAAAQLFDGGQYKEAADAYLDLVTKYPTSLVASSAQFRLAYLYYVLGDYEKSVLFLKKIVGPPAPPDIQELANSMMPQVLAAQAAKLTEETQRKDGFEAAIKEFDHFTETYPKSAAVEAAVYGRSLASFHIGKYEDAVAFLRANLRRFANSASILDSQYLLALTLATQANLASQTDPSSADAGARYGEAEKLLYDIIGKGTDVALANDAQFQIGELLFNRGLLGSKEERNDLWEKAIAACRGVLPKEPMIAAEEARINAVKQRRLAALKSWDAALFRNLERVADREAAKLAAIKAGSDLSVTAQIKVGEIYFRQEMPDAARVLLRQMQQFAPDEGQKKSIQYYLTLTYASQRLIPQAVRAYSDFKASFNADPMAENLPLLIGSLFLSADPGANNPSKAVEFFKEGAQMYPSGSLLSETLAQEAGALVQLKQLDEARALFEQILSLHPKPDVAAAAEFGLGTVCKDTGKINDALIHFKKVRGDHAGTPQAEQAAFWIGQLALESGDVASAVAEATAFLKNFPKSEFCPGAKFNLAEAAFSKGDTTTAFQLFTEVAAEFPKSSAASLSYFRRAAILAGERKAEEMVALMKEFIGRYPDDDKIFYAYDTLGQNQMNSGRIPEAIATYSEMVEKHPAVPQLSVALLDLVQLWRRDAEKQGRYLALSARERAEWNKAVASSMAAAERLIGDHPQSKEVAIALHEVLEDQKLLVAAGIKTSQDLTNYFQGLVQKFEQEPQTRSKIIFTLASFTYGSDQKAALEQMTAAYNPQFLYANEDIDLYGAALLEAGKVEESLAVYQKLAADNPNPPGVAPSNAPVRVQDAQAIALFGIGRAWQQQGKVADAGVAFEAFKKFYPWNASAKILEADFGIAQSKHQQGHEEEAAGLLVQVVQAPTASSDLRAKAMLLLGAVNEAKKEIAAAIDQYIKIAVFYEGVPKTASEGLWKGAQLLERQAAALPETSAKKDDPTKSGQLKKAIEAYTDLVAKYPDSEHGNDAKARLKALQIDVTR